MAMEPEYKIMHYADWIGGQQKRSRQMCCQQVISRLSRMELDLQPQPWVKCAMGTTVQLARNQEQKRMDQDTDQHIVYIWIKESEFPFDCG